MPTLSRFQGRNGQKAPTQIADAECTKCQNLFLSSHSLLLRLGSSISITDSLDTTDPLWGLHRSYIVAGTPFWMWMVGNTARSLKTGSQVTIKTLAASNKQVNFVEANGSIYILPNNTTDKVQKSDGTSGGTIDHPSAACPRASIGVWHNNRLYLNDLNDGGKVWFSSTFAPDTFIDQSSSATATDGGWMKVSYGDGDKVTGFGKLGSVLFIFKERSIHMHLGTSFVLTDPTAFQLIELNRGIGTKSPRSIVPTETGLMFLDSDGKVRFYYGPARQIFAEPGRPLEDLTKAIPQSGLLESAGFYYDRKYFLSFWSSAGTYNDTTFALDVRLMAPTLGWFVDQEVPSFWSEITANAWNSGLVDNGQSGTGLPFYATSHTGGTITQFLSGLTDTGGVAIPYAWRSKAYGADAPSNMKSFNEVTAASRTFSSPITLEAYADKPALSATATATHAITPLNTTYAINTWRPAVKGSVLQAGLSGSSSVGGEIVAVEWDWTPRRKEIVS